MNRTIKSLFGLTLLVCFLFSTAGCLSFNKAPDKEEMEKCFIRDKEDLMTVADYLTNLNYSSVWIEKPEIKDGVMFTGSETRYQTINDKTALETINRLINNKDYIRIGKDSNSIFFEKWNHFEKEAGFVISINGNQSPSVEFLVELEPLSEDKWYYYLSDYEEWRNKK